MPKLNVDRERELREKNRTTASTTKTPAKSAAERAREYRARRKAKEANAKKTTAKSAAERMREYRARRKMLRELAQSMQAEMQANSDTNNKNESTDPLSSVGLPPNVTNFEIKTECLSIIKEEPMDNNEGKIETYNEEEIQGTTEFCEDNRNFVFINVGKIETDGCEEKGTSNETTENRKNKDLVSTNIDNVEETEGYKKGKSRKGMHNQGIRQSKRRIWSENRNDIFNHYNSSVNAVGIQENVSTGLCIVNFSFVWSEIQRTFNDHASLIDCQFKYWSLVNYRRKGLVTEFVFKCRRCLYETSILSDSENVDEKAGH